MRKSLSFVAAASLAIGGMSFTAQADQPSGGQQSSSGQQNQQSGSAQSQQPQIIREEIVIYGVLVPQRNTPQGSGKTEAPGMSGIRQVFGQATQAAFQKGSESKLLDFLSSKDRQRLQESFTKADQGNKLDQVLSQLDQTWKQKYNTNFDASQGAVALGDEYTIVEGRANPALLSNWPVQQDSGAQQNQDGSSKSQDQQKSSDAHNGQHASGESSGQQSGNRSGQADAGQQNANQKQVAVVVLPAEGSMPETRVSLIQEGGSWKIEIPDNIDGQKLHDNLVKQMTWLSQHSDQWPKDPKEAYAPATHHLLMALYGQDAQQSSQSGQGSQNQ